MEINYFNKSYKRNKYHSVVYYMIINNDAESIHKGVMGIHDAIHGRSRIVLDNVVKPEEIKHGRNAVKYQIVPCTLPTSGPTGNCGHHRLHVEDGCLLSGVMTCKLL